MNESTPHATKNSGLEDRLYGRITVWESTLEVDEQSLGTSNGKYAILKKMEMTQMKADTQCFIRYKQQSYIRFR